MSPTVSKVSNFCNGCWNVGKKYWPWGKQTWKNGHTEFFIDSWFEERVLTSLRTRNYKIHYKKLLTSLQKSVTKFITKSYPLHHKKILQNSLQTVTDIIRCFKVSFPKWKHSPAMKIMNQWINQWINEKSYYFLEW